MSIDARIPLMVQQVASPLDRQMKLSDLAYRQQAMDMQRQRAEQEQAERQQAQQREQVAMTVRLLDGVQDESTYQQALAAGRRFGLDVSAAPANYDPNWVGEHRLIGQTILRPDGQQKLSTAAQQAQELTGLPITHPETRKVMARLLADNVPVQAGGAVYTNDPLTGFAPGIVPNPGGAAAGAPAGGYQEGATATNPQTGEKIIFRNGAWQPMGGTAGNGGGGFPTGQ